MQFRSVKPVRTAKIGSIAASAALCIIGLIFMVAPDLSMRTIGIILGIVLSAFGAFRIVGYLSKDLYRLAYQFDLEIGIVLLAAGIVILFKPERMMNFISIALGILLLVEGLFKIRVARDAKRFGIERWWLTVILAVATFVLGVVLIYQYALGAKLLTVLLGVALLAEGVLNLYAQITMVKIIKNQVTDEV